MAKINPKAKKVHCHWCSKEVAVTYKGRLAEHKLSGITRCMGGGQPAKFMEAHNKLLKECLEERRNG